MTSWHHYDTIYTERYMFTPEANPEGYAKRNAISMMLIKALQAAGKSFDVQVGPDAGHSGINQQRMMEFFIEALVLNKHAAIQ